jgi:hypothetical protein
MGFKGLACAIHSEFFFLFFTSGLINSVCRERKPCPFMRRKLGCLLSTMVLCAVNNGPLSSTMVVVVAVAVAAVYTSLVCIIFARYVRRYEYQRVKAMPFLFVIDNGASVCCCRQWSHVPSSCCCCCYGRPWTMAG